MKKLFTLIIVAGLALTIQAQHITNTIGTDGFFYIESENNTELLTVGSFAIGNGLTQFSFSNNLGYSTGFSINNYGNNNLFLNLMKARGIAGTPESVESGDVLGTINFEGYHGSYHPSASISVSVSGDPDSHIPGTLIFKTGTETTAPATRMTIDKSGTIGVYHGIIVAGQSYLNSDVTIKKTLGVLGAVRMSTKTVTADSSFTLDVTSYTIFHTISGNTVTLPEAATNETGLIYIIKSGAGVTTTVAPPTGGQTIDGSTANITIAAWKYIKVQSTGTSWIITGGNYQ